MKRTLSVLLSLILLLSFGTSACAEAASYRYTSGIPEDVAIHCTETVMDVMNIEELSRLVGMIKYSIEPQAVELLRTSFPAFEEAARMGQLGTQIGFEVVYDESDATPLGAVRWEFDPDDVGQNWFTYKLIVNAFLFAERDADGNLVRDPVTGKLYMTAAGENLIRCCDILTHEMMHAFMDDYNRSGMTGYIDPEMLFLPAYASDEDAAAAEAHYEAAAFPKWFVEGCATTVDDEYSRNLEMFEELRSYGQEDLDGWCSPEILQYTLAEPGELWSGGPEDYMDNTLTFDGRVDVYVTGYLACLYLAELAVNSEGRSACFSRPDGFIVLDSTVLRSGLNNIIRMLHEGLTLDDIIYNISGGRFYDTVAFEDAFIAYDDDSAMFCSDYLNYMLLLSREDGRRDPPGGSVLCPFETEYLSQYDYTKNTVSGLYQIVNTRDAVESTADLQNVTDAGKSLSYWGYWNNAAVGAGSYYDDYYNEPYSYPDYPVY